MGIVCAILADRYGHLTMSDKHRHSAKVNRLYQEATVVFVELSIVTQSEKGAHARCLCRRSGHTKVNGIYRNKYG